MAPGVWLQIQVILIAGRGKAIDPPPGRILLAGGSQTFADLAHAIDRAFARWDLDHVHGFELGDGRRIGTPYLELDEPVWLDETSLYLADELEPGDELTYTFDFGDEWQHRCIVLEDRIYPRQETGQVPKYPIPIWGWGSIPDQYGRVHLDDGE